MQIFEKMGIPGPKPNFLFGNLLAFWRMVSLSLQIRTLLQTNFILTNVIINKHFINACFFFLLQPLFKKYQEWYREYGKTFG